MKEITNSFSKKKKIMHDGQPVAIKIHEILVFPLFKHRLLNYVILYAALVPESFFWNY